jgi:hypothetical protein
MGIRRGAEGDGDAVGRLRADAVRDQVQDRLRACGLTPGALRLSTGVPASPERDPSRAEFRGTVASETFQIRLRRARGTTSNQWAVQV